ncbi:hypothetical protein R5W60_05405 [Brucella pseudintermedia]|uniref:hypothetical protein n=1 Tax=Brucella pseudintermedia TaxID=370111 RepID=UPI00366F43DC|nr:hypothetical protein R5W60_05405 [Brucella pseudintermedia]
MEEIKTGGAAFPVTFEGGSNNGDAPFFHQGMTLRDYFAGKALAGIYANKGAPVIMTYDSPQGRAVICYAMADAMIAAREGGAK